MPAASTRWQRFEGSTDHSQASAANCFGGYSWERAVAQREDREWLRHKLRDPTTRVVALHESRNLFDHDQAPLFLAPGGDWEEDWLETLPVVFLCEEENTAYFAVDLTEADLKITQASHRPGEFKDLKAQAALLAARDAALLAYARAMAHWHRTHQFCGTCGARTESLSGGHMRRCGLPACRCRRRFPSPTAWCRSGSMPSTVSIAGKPLGREAKACCLNAKANTRR